MIFCTYNIYIYIMPYPLVQDFVQEYENLERCQNEASLHHVHSKRTASSCCTSCCKVSSVNRDNAIEIILVPYVQNHMVRHARRANSYGKYIIYTYIGSFFKASVSAEELSSGKCPFSAAQRGYYFPNVCSNLKIIEHRIPTLFNHTVML